MRTKQLRGWDAPLLHSNYFIICSRNMTRVRVSCSTRWALMKLQNETNNKKFSLKRGANWMLREGKSGYLNRVCGCGLFTFCFRWETLISSVNEHDCMVKNKRFRSYVITYWNRWRYKEPPSCLFFKKRSRGSTTHVTRYPERLTSKGSL